MSLVSFSLSSDRGSDRLLFSPRDDETSQVCHNSDVDVPASSGALDKGKGVVHMSSTLAFMLTLAVLFSSSARHFSCILSR